MTLVDAIPTKWRQSLKLNIDKQRFVIQEKTQLNLKGHCVLISKAISKGIGAELRSKITTPPTAQARYAAIFKNDLLEWKDIYKLPFRGALDTKSREFQYKLLNRYLVTNVLLKKWEKQCRRPVLSVVSRTNPSNIYSYPAPLLQLSGQI